MHSVWNLESRESHLLMKTMIVEVLVRFRIKISARVERGMMAIQLKDATVLSVVLSTRFLVAIVEQSLLLFGDLNIQVVFSKSTSHYIAWLLMAG